jgi:hypothetical protein
MKTLGEYRMSLLRILALLISRTPKFFGAFATAAGILGIYSAITGQGLIALFSHPPSAVELCDTAAADPEDPNHLGQGVSNISNAMDAIKYCQVSSKDTNAPRYSHQLARAFAKAGMTEAALVEYKTQADRNYVISIARYAELLFARPGNITDAALNEARNYISRAIKENCPYGVYLQDRWYLSGVIGARSAEDIEIGNMLIEKSAKMGSPEAIRYLTSHR